MSSDIKRQAQYASIWGNTMTNYVNRQVVLRSRPRGIPALDDFQFREEKVPSIAPGQVLRRTTFLSLDPYVRRMMSTEESQWAPMPLDKVIAGDTVSEVIESLNPDYSEGDFVLGGDGWQEYAVSDGRGLRKIDPELKRKSLMLGALGMPGHTAYGALLDIGRPVEGETVVISAAAGAIGSIAGQIAKIKGCRTVGITSSDEKCRVVTDVLGFDACINYRAEDVSSGLKRTCPGGIDIYYDNVAGPILEAVLENLKGGARIALVGLISQYNAGGRPSGPNLVSILHAGALIQGYGGDHSKAVANFQNDMPGWISSGQVKPLEHIVTGLENAPSAFIGLFTGENIGKLIVQFD